MFTYPYQMFSACVDVFVHVRKNNEDWFLCIIRKNDPYKNCFALPGGHVNVDETTATAAIRELREETGIQDIKNITFIDFFDAVKRDPSGRKISFLYCVTLDEFPKVVAADDAIDYAWIKFDEIECFEFAFDHIEMINLSIRISDEIKDKKEGLMSKNTHKAFVIEINLEPHPNADSLSIVRPFPGCTVCSRTEDWANRRIAAYIPPENLVDTTRDEFKFLAVEGKDNWQKIKVRKLRGVTSQGLLVPIPATFQVGDDVTEYLGIKHYEEVTPNDSKDEESPPTCFNFPLSKYDIDSIKGFLEYVEGEEVICTEKIHGSNMRITYDKNLDKIYVGGRNIWHKESANNPYWKAVSKHPEIFDCVKRNPGLVVCGEMYGLQGGYGYGLQKGTVDFVAFDILRTEANEDFVNSRQYLDYDEFKEVTDAYNMPTTPFVFRGTFDLDHIVELANGKSFLDKKTGKEGIVVKPVREKKTDKFERVVFKIIGADYKG